MKEMSTAILVRLPPELEANFTKLCTGQSIGRSAGIRLLIERALMEGRVLTRNELDAVKKKKRK